MSRALYGTWRVVTPRGKVVNVRVWSEYCECGCKQSPTWVKVDGDATTYGVDRNGEANERAIRAKIGEAIACEEIRAPGQLTTAERVAEAASASAEGYRSGVRFRVLEALAGVRDAAQAIVKTDGDWDDSNCGGQCVAVIEEAMAAVITSGR